MWELALYLHLYKSNCKNSQDFILTKKVYQETFRKKELQGTSRLYCKLPVTVVNIAQLRLSCWRLHLEKVSVVARLIWLRLCDVYTYSMFTCYCLFFFDKMFTGLCTLYSFVSYPWFSTSTPSNLSPGFFFFCRECFFKRTPFYCTEFQSVFYLKQFFFCLHQTQICFVSENVLRYFRYL